MLEELRHFCLELKGTTEDIKWENHLCFCVGTKMYFVTSPDSVPISASLKVSDEDFERLTAKEGVIPAPYMARYKWIHIDDIERFSQNEIIDLVKRSYTLVAGKLPKKLQNELGLM